MKYHIKCRKWQISEPEESYEFGSKTLEWDIEAQSKREAFQKLYEDVRIFYPKSQGYSIQRFYEDEELVQLEVFDRGIVASLDEITLTEE